MFRLQLTRSEAHELLGMLQAYRSILRHPSRFLDVLIEKLLHYIFMEKDHD